MRVHFFLIYRVSFIRNVCIFFNTRDGVLNASSCIRQLMDYDYPRLQATCSNGNMLNVQIIEMP